MIRRIVGAIAAFLLLFGMTAYADTAPEQTLVVVPQQAVVYADVDLTEKIGTLEEGAVVYVGAAPANHPEERLVVFLYPYIQREGYVLAQDVAALEDSALAEYLNSAADGILYEGHPLMPCAFVPFTEVQSSEPSGGTQSMVRIVSQPKDQKGRVGQTVIFELEAYGAVSYCWQFHNGRVWKNSTLPGCQGPAMRVEVTERRLGYHYRCILTDANGNSVFSDEVGFAQ